MEGLKLYIFPDIGSVIMTIHFQKESDWTNVSKFLACLSL